MTAKQYLQKVYRLNQLIVSNKQEVESLRALLNGVPSLDYSKDKIQTTLPNDANFAKIVEKIIDLEKMILKDIDETWTLYLKIRSVIDELENIDERLLLKYRYLNFMSWSEICDRMRISTRTAHRIHSSALEKIKKNKKILKIGTLWH